MLYTLSCPRPNATLMTAGRQRSDGSFGGQDRSEYAKLDDWVDSIGARGSAGQLMTQCSDEVWPRGTRDG